MSIVEHPAKAIYLANRHPRMTRDEFRERWLTHSRVGEVLAGGPQPIAGLRYCLTVDPTGLLPGASNEHDGVGLLALRSVVSIPTMHAVLTRNDVALRRRTAGVRASGRGRHGLRRQRARRRRPRDRRGRDRVRPTPRERRPRRPPAGHRAPARGRRICSKPVCAAGCATSRSARRHAASGTTP